jgi:catechol 2,3-dioxygenase-like lactoylglutathione lyase family enzyme
VISHISFGVRDLERAIAFYDAVAKPLGAERLWTKADGAGYGYRGTEDALALKLRSEASAPGPGFHCAFDADSRAAVDAFHAAAIAAGGMDNGAPGLRPHFGESYYAAFVVDPDGHRIEALCTAGM